MQFAKVMLVASAAAIIADTSANAQPAERGPFECDRYSQQRGHCQPLPPPKWIKVEAANGQAAYVDVASTVFRQDFVPPFESGRTGKVVRALIYYEDGAPIGGSNAGWFDYECDRPHLLSQRGVWPPRPAQYLPPNSFGFQIRGVACGISGTSGISQDKKNQPVASIDEAIKEVEQMMKDPEKVKLLECLGIEVFEDPKPPGHPPSKEVCAKLTPKQPQ